jgi:hypothetical protein
MIIVATQMGHGAQIRAKAFAAMISHEAQMHAKAFAAMMDHGAQMHAKAFAAMMDHGAVALNPAIRSEAIEGTHSQEMVVRQAILSVEAGHTAMSSAVGRRIRAGRAVPGYIMRPHLVSREKKGGAQIISRPLSDLRGITSVLTTLMRLAVQSGPHVLQMVGHRAETVSAILPTMSLSHKRKNVTLHAFPMDAFSKGLVQYSARMPSSGRKFHRTQRAFLNRFRHRSQRTRM